MNKKGFLLAEETLKIIIALISISFLVYFLVSLYMSNKDNKELELAKASLEHLTSEINAQVSEVDIYSPNNNDAWFIVGWPVSEEIPLSCQNLDWKKCLCICKFKKTTELINPSSLSKRCGKEGICKENTYLVNNNGDFHIKINHPFITLKLNKDSNTISLK